MFRRFLAALAAALLVGCGGGGGGAGGGSTPNASDAVLSNCVTAASSGVCTPVLPKLAAKIAAGLPITVVSFGSSVGLGASLSDPTTQSPLGHLVATIQARSAGTVTGVNRSIYGSIAAQLGTLGTTKGAWQSMVDDGIVPDVVLVIYGMNDGFPTAYNSTEPPDFYAKYLGELVLEAKAAGAEVIIATTPHPRSTATWAISSGYNQVYPTAIAAPVSPDQMMPSASTSVVWTAVGGSSVPESVRHLDVNAQARQVAYCRGAVLADVEPAWFQAVATYGENALFDTGETVHPNLLAHQLTYQASLDAIVASATKGCPQ